MWEIHVRDLSQTCIQFILDDSHGACMCGSEHVCVDDAPTFAYAYI